MGAKHRHKAKTRKSAFNTEPPLFSLFSAANPVVGERFSLDADSALIRTCESGGNMAAVMGWPEKSGTYGFAVHFNPLHQSPKSLMLIKTMLPRVVLFIPLAEDPTTTTM